MGGSCCSPLLLLLVETTTSPDSSVPPPSPSWALKSWAWALADQKEEAQLVQTPLPQPHSQSPRLALKADCSMSSGSNGGGAVMRTLD